MLNNNYGSEYYAPLEKWQELINCNSPQELYNSELVLNRYFGSPVGWNKFQQIDLLCIKEKSDVPINKEGTCKGLGMMYAAYHLQNDKSQNKIEFINKLQIQLETPEESFLRNIFLYQCKSYSKIPLSSSISHVNDFPRNCKVKNYLPKNLQQFDFLGIYLDGPGTHLITLHIIKNENQEILGYKLFDPNFGETELMNDEIMNLTFHWLVEHPHYEFRKLRFAPELTSDIGGTVQKAGFIADQQVGELSSMDFEFDITTLGYLIKIGARINGSPKDKNPILLRAINSHNIPILQLLLENNVDLDVTSIWPHTILEYTSARYGKNDEITTILSNAYAAKKNKPVLTSPSQTDLIVKATDQANFNSNISSAKPNYVEQIIEKPINKNDNNSDVNQIISMKTFSCPAGKTASISNISNYSNCLTHIASAIQPPRYSSLLSYALTTVAIAGITFLAASATEISPIVIGISVSIATIGFTALLCKEKTELKFETNSRKAKGER